MEACLGWIVSNELPDVVHDVHRRIPAQFVARSRWSIAGRASAGLPINHLDVSAESVCDFQYRIAFCVRKRISVARSFIRYQNNAPGKVLHICEIALLCPWLDDSQGTTILV